MISPDGVEPPDGVGFPDGMEPPDGMGFPDGMEPPDGMELPDDTVSPNGMEPSDDTVFPDGMEPSDDTVSPDGMEPSGRPDMSGSENWPDRQEIREASSRPFTPGTGEEQRGRGQTSPGEVVSASAISGDTLLLLGISVFALLVGLLFAVKTKH